MPISNYWGERAEGVEAHAAMKMDSRTRRRRIATLLADMRKFQRRINHSSLCLGVWEELAKADEVPVKAKLPPILNFAAEAILPKSLYGRQSEAQPWQVIALKSLTTTKRA